MPPPLQLPALPAHVTALMPDAHANAFNAGAYIRRAAAASERWLAALTPRRLLLLLLLGAFLAGPGRIASLAHGVATLPLRPLSALGEWVDFAAGAGSGPAAAAVDEHTTAVASVADAANGAGAAAGPSAASLAAAESLRAAAAGASASGLGASDTVASGADAALGVGAEELARATDLDFWMQAAAAAASSASTSDEAGTAAAGTSAYLPSLPVAPLAALLARVAAMDRRIAAHYSVISDSLLPRLDGAEAMANNAVKAASAAGTAAEDAGRRADAAAAAAREATGTLAAAAAAVGAVAEQAAAVQALKSDLSSLTNDVTQLRAGHASSAQELLAAVQAAQAQQSAFTTAMETTGKSAEAAQAEVRSVAAAVSDVSGRVAAISESVHAVSESISAAHNASAAAAAAAAATAAAAQASAEAALAAAVERIVALENRARALEEKAAALAAAESAAAAGSVTSSATTEPAGAGSSTEVAGAAVTGDAGAVAALSAAVAELRQQTHAALTAAVGAAVATGAGRVRPSVHSWKALHEQFAQWRAASAVAPGATGGAPEHTLQQGMGMGMLSTLVASVLALADGVEHGMRGHGAGAGAGEIPLPPPVAVSAGAAALPLAPLTAVTRVVSPSAVTDGYFGVWLSSVAASASSSSSAAASSASASSLVASLGDVAAMVNAAIAAYAADGVALPDYALASSGACVVTDAPAYALTSRTWAPAAAGTAASNASASASASALAVPGPRTALTPSLQLGHCWPMAGSEGRITVRLARPIAVTAVTIDHPQTAIALDRSTAAIGSSDASALPPQLGGLNSAAPRAFRLYGYTTAATAAAAGSHSGAGAGSSDAPVDGVVAIADVNGDAAGLLRRRRVLLGSFAYDATGPRTQTFLLPHAQAQAHAEGAGAGQGEVFSHVTLEVASNHGNRDFTCLYRLRVHGTVPHVHGKAAQPEVAPVAEPEVAAAGFTSGSEPQAVHSHHGEAVAPGRTDAPAHSDAGVAAHEQH